MSVEALALVSPLRIPLRGYFLDSVTKLYYYRRIFNMKDSYMINPCGYCGEKSNVSVYFSLKDEESYFVVECSHCGTITRAKESEEEAIKEWNEMFPLLF